MIRPLLISALLAVGLWQIGAAFSIQAKAWLGQVLLERAWAKTKQNDEPVAPWPGSVSHPIARLSVPELEIDYLVLDGADTPVLAWGPGMEIGPNGHRLIAAHRDTHFRFLEQIRPGQQVLIGLADGKTEHWRVVDQQIVDSRRYDLDLAASGSHMTWITCWPFDAIEAGGPLRLLVTLEKSAGLRIDSHSMAAADGLSAES
ncbi:MAG: sortase [Pseudomonadota bacterium]